MTHPDDNSPGWVKDRRAREVRNAQRVRGQISTLDNDTLFWVEFDSSGPRAFERILARKVGDAATYRVQRSWLSAVDSAIASLHWRDVEQSYPPNSSNETMRIVRMNDSMEAKLAMLMHHESYDLVRHICQDEHNKALLSRAQLERLVGLT